MIADRLGKSVKEVLDFSVDEVQGWIAYFNYLKKQTDSNIAIDHYNLKR